MAIAEYAIAEIADSWSTAILEITFPQRHYRQSDEVSSYRRSRTLKKRQSRDYIEERFLVMQPPLLYFLHLVCVVCVYGEIDK